MSKFPPLIVLPKAPFTAANKGASATGAITPAALGATVFPIPTRGIWVGTAGHLHVVMGDGIDVFLSNVPVGRLDIAVTQVLSDTTTAANMTALF